MRNKYTRYIKRLHSDKIMKRNGKLKNNLIIKEDLTRSWYSKNEEEDAAIVIPFYILEQGMQRIIEFLEFDIEYNL